MSHTQTALTQEEPGWQQGRDELLHTGFWLSSSPPWKKSLLAGSRGPAGPGAAALAPWGTKSTHIEMMIHQNTFVSLARLCQKQCYPQSGSSLPPPTFLGDCLVCVSFSTLDIPRHWAFLQNITCVRCLARVCCLLTLYDTLHFIKRLLITLTQFSRGFS